MAKSSKTNLEQFVSQPWDFYLHFIDSSTQKKDAARRPMHQHTSCFRTNRGAWGHGTAFTNLKQEGPMIFFYPESETKPLTNKLGTNTAIEKDCHIPADTVFSDLIKEKTVNPM